MTETETMLKMCLGKKAYRGEKYALKIAEDLKALRGVDLRVYLCPICYRYHLTRQSAGERSKVKGERSELGRYGRDLQHT